MAHNLVFWLICLIVSVWMTILIDDVIENVQQKKREKLLAKTELERLEKIING